MNRLRTNNFDQSL